MSAGVIYWLRNDLRLHDNPALLLALRRASEQGGWLLPVYTAARPWCCRNWRADSVPVAWSARPSPRPIPSPPSAKSLNVCGVLILTRSLEEACEIGNRIAAELRLR